MLESIFYYAVQGVIAIGYFLMISLFSWVMYLLGHTAFGYYLRKVRVLYKYGFLYFVVALLLGVLVIFAFFGALMLLGFLYDILVQSVVPIPVGHSVNF